MSYLCWDTTPPTPLQDEVLSIIDTKLQFIDYELNSFLAKQSPLRACEARSSTGSATAFAAAPTTVDEDVLSMIELSSHKKSILLLLRRLLKEENAKDILNLLGSNRFQYYSNDQIQQYLSKEQKVEGETRSSTTFIKRPLAA